MIIILPFILAIMMLVIMIAVSALTFATSAAGMAVGSAIRSSDARSIQIILFIGGLVGFGYSWFATGSLDHERGFEYAFSLILKLSISLIAVSIVIGCIAIAMKVFVWWQKRYPNTPSRISLLHSAGMGLLLGGVILLIIEYQLIGDSYSLHAAACLDYALFQKYGPWLNTKEFVWCLSEWHP